MTRSIVELESSGITLEANEAVAIAQQLISDLLNQRANELQPPYGPPSPDNVWLGDDGSVVCRGCSTTPAVSEVGIFLETLLTADSRRVPGGLRYTIARALLNVDVPPFDSLDDLSRDLKRHEHGARADLVRGVLTRARGERTAALSPVERRTARASASELRRALREADARWYEYQPTATPARVLDVHPPALPPRDRSTTAAAACLAAGLALIGTGEFMHRRQPLIPVTPMAPIAAQPVYVEAPRVELEPGILAVRDVPSGSTRLVREPRRVVVKYAVARSSTPAVRRQAGSRPSDRKASPAVGAQGKPTRSVIDRLRLGWLRTAFKVRSDL